jgi:hypothetical protein
VHLQWLIHIVDVRSTFFKTVAILACQGIPQNKGFAIYCLKNGPATRDLKLHGVFSCIFLQIPVQFSSHNGPLLVAFKSGSHPLHFLPGEHLATGLCRSRNHQGCTSSPNGKGLTSPCPPGPSTSPRVRNKAGMGTYRDQLRSCPHTYL